MSGTVFQGTVFNTFKKTLDSIAQDTRVDNPKREFMRKVFDVRSNDEAYVDDLEMAGPGLLSEKPEGAEMAVGTMNEGPKTRYFHRTYAGRMLISHEAASDSKYPEALRLAARLRRAAKKTIEYDAANVFARGFDTEYPLADGLPLWSASHALVQGGTFSNTLATPQAPSTAALIDVTTEVRRQVDHQGIIDGLMVEKIICPIEQWAVWSQVLNSTYTPVPGNFSEINVINNDMNLTNSDVCANPFWSNTSTQWAVKTDAEEGFKWFNRETMTSKSWVENSQLVMQYAVYYRSSRGVTDPRCTYGSQS